MPLISVGMPVYNSEKYLREAFDCICNQSFRDIEIIVSDNGSTDSTQTIIQEYMERDDRIVFYQQPENLGPIPNFRFLLEKARCDYFLWRSYDDLSDKNYLEVLYDLLENSSQNDLAVGRVIRQRMDGSIAGTIDFPWDGTTVPIDRRLLLRKTHPGWMYGLFRRSKLIPAIDGVLEKYPHIWAWDHLVLAPFAIGGSITGSNKTSFSQRETGISQSTLKPMTSKDQIRLISDFMRYVRSVIDKTELPFLTRWQLRVSLIAYTNGRTEKFRRVLRRAVKEVFGQF